ncbi:hypothetical protein, partial [Paenibacillus typhae]|uniref:hypothetical protein n=1 Tax=Paenibacillus typhae TaxID=1174501 RepID=UPI0039EF02EA
KIKEICRQQRPEVQTFSGVTANPGKVTQKLNIDFESIIPLSFVHYILIIYKNTLIPLMSFRRD